MIRLTRYRDKKPVYVFPEAIISAEIVDDATMINARSDRIFVTESPQEVARKVLEWRLAMERYRAGVHAEAKEAGEEAKTLAWARDVEYRIMLNLAGLEEPQNAHP